MLERFSKLWIKSPPAISSEDLDKLLAQRRYISINRIQEYITPEAKLEQDWVTIAVLASKSEVRKSKIGTNYIIFTLSNLEETEIKLFIFSDAYENWWKEPCGTILGILNASPLSSTNQPLSYKVEKAAKLLNIGIAADYGRCSGIDGISRCEGYVNL